MKNREIVIRIQLPRSPRKRWLLGTAAAVMLGGAIAYAATVWPASFVSGQPVSSADLKFYLNDLNNRDYVVTGNNASTDINPSAGAIAHVPFTAPAAGYATVDWTVTVGMNGASGSCDIVLGAFTAAKVPVYTDSYVSYAYLPSYPQYEQLSISGHAALAVVAGANNIYLNGNACAGSYFRRPVINVRFEPSASVTTGALVVN